MAPAAKQLEQLATCVMVQTHALHAQYQSVAAALARADLEMQQYVRGREETQARMQEVHDLVEDIEDQLTSVRSSHVDNDSEHHDNDNDNDSTAMVDDLKAELAELLDEYALEQELIAKLGGVIAFAQQTRVRLAVQLAQLRRQLKRVERTKVVLLHVALRWGVAHLSLRDKMRGLATRKR